MGQPKHILVVDDEGDVRDVLVEILQKDNYRVSSVANGALMRDFLGTDDAVDCVVLDSLMPGESSFPGAPSEGCRYSFGNDFRKP
jgi:two-component system OmpR family response regulator